MEPMTPLRRNHEHDDPRSPLNRLGAAEQGRRRTVGSGASLTDSLARPAAFASNRMTARDQCAGDAYV